MSRSEHHCFARSIGASLRLAPHILLTGLLLAACSTSVDPAATPSASPSGESAPDTTTLPPANPDSATVLFHDDFQDSVLDGWAVEPVTWSQEDGTWVTGSTWTIEDDGGDLVLSNEAPTGRPASAELGGRNFADFTFQAQVKLLEGTPTLRLRSYEQGEDRGTYFVHIGPEDIVLSKERNDEGSDLASAPAAVGYGQWRTLTVTAEGVTITITLDGAPVLTYEDSDDPILTGMIVLSNEGHFHLDDVTISLDIPSRDTVAWTPLSPMPAGGVWGISIAPSDPDVIYLATHSTNAFRSEDGGRTWAPTAALGAHIFAPIAVHPKNPDIIYVSNGVLHRSEDGGDSSYDMSIEIDHDPMIRSIAIHRDDPTIVYAADDTGEVYKTETGGRDWEQVSTLDGIPQMGSLLVHPTDPDSLFVTVQDSGVYRSADGGINWSRVLSIAPADQSLVMHPDDPDTLYVTDGERIYRTSDAGETWTALTLSPPEPTHLAVAPGNPSVLYVSTPKRVYRTDDGGESWSPSVSHTSPADPSRNLLVPSGDGDMVFGASMGHIVRPGPTSVLAVSPEDADVVYAGSEEGMTISTDGGATWARANDGLDDLDAWQLATSPTDSDRLYVGTLCMRGLFRTTNAGSNWTLVPQYFHYVMDIAVVPSRPEEIYVTHHTGLYQSFDDGDTWRFVEDTLGYHLHGLAVDPVDPDVAYVGSVAGEGEYSIPSSAAIFKTTDGGESWTEVNNGFPAAATSVQAIVIDPTDNDTVYVATYKEGLSHDMGAGIGIYKSTDGGGSWAPINHGLTTPNVNALALDPFDPQTVYAGTDVGLFVSTDSGEEWKPVSGAPGTLINAVVPDHAARGTVYVTTEGAGVFRTTDGGASWVSLNLGLPLLPTGDLILDPGSGEIYVAVRGAGVYKGVPEPTS